MMATAKQHLSDPRFMALPISDRINILSSEDPNYKAIPSIRDKYIIAGGDPVSAPAMTGGDFSDPSGQVTPNVAPDKIAYTGPTPSMSAGGAAALAMAMAPETAGLSLPAAAIIEGGAGAMGAAGGEALSQIYQHAKNFIKGQPFGSNGAPASVDQAASGMQKTLGPGLVQGAAGPVLSKVADAAGPLISKIMAPEAAGSFLPGGAEELAARVAANKAEGVAATPAEITQSPGLQWLENKLRRSPSGAEAFRKFDVANISAKIAKRNDLMQTMAPKALADAEVLGQSIQKQLNGAIDAAGLATEAEKTAAKDAVLKDLGARETSLNLGNDIQAAAKQHADFLQNAKNQQYANVYANAPPEISSKPTNLINELQKTKTILANTPEPLRGADWNKLSGQVDGMLDLTTPQIDPNAVDPETGAKTADMISYYRSIGNNAKADALQASAPMLHPSSNYVQLDAMRKSFSKSAQDEFGSHVSTMYDNLKQATMKDMGDLAESSGNQALFDSHKIANAANGDYKNYMGSPMFKSIMRENPQALADTIYAPGNESEIDRFKSTFGDAMSNRIKAKVTDGLFDSGTKDLTGDMVRANLNKYGETASHIWSPQEIGQINQTADVLDGAQRAGDAIAKNPILRAAINKNPTAAVNAIVRPNTGEVAPIELVRRYAGQGTVDDLGEAWLGKVLMKDQDNGFDPQKALNLYSQYGPKQASALLGPAKANAVEQSIKTMAMSKAESTVTKMPGGYFNHPLLTILGWKMMLRNPAAAAGVVAMQLAPRQVAQLYLSPLAQKWMTEGLTTSIFSDSAPAIFQHLAEAAVKLAPRAAAGVGSYLYQKGKRDE